MQSQRAETLGSGWFLTHVCFVLQKRFIFAARRSFRRLVLVEKQRCDDFGDVHDWLFKQVPCHKRKSDHQAKPQKRIDTKELPPDDIEAIYCTSQCRWRQSNCPLRHHLSARHITRDGYASRYAGN